MIGGVPYRVWANRILAGSAVLYALVFVGQFYIPLPGMKLYIGSFNRRLSVPWRTGLP